MKCKRDEEKERFDLTLGVRAYMSLVKWSLFKLVRPFKGTSRAFLKNLMYGRSTLLKQLLGDQKYNAFVKQCLEIIDLSYKSSDFSKVLDSEKAARARLAVLLEVKPEEVYKGEMVTPHQSNANLLLSIFSIDPKKSIVTLVNATIDGDRLSISAISVASSLAIWPVMEIFLKQLLVSPEHSTNYYANEYCRLSFKSDDFRRTCPGIDQSIRLKNPFSDPVQPIIRDERFFLKRLLEYCLINPAVMIFSRLPFEFFKNFILQNLQVINSRINHSQSTMLMLFSVEGKIDICDFLLECGASPFDTDKSGFNTLHCVILSILNEDDTILLLRKMLAKKWNDENLYFHNFSLPEFALISKKPKVAVWLTQEYQFVNIKRDRSLLTMSLHAAEPAEIRSVVDAGMRVGNVDLMATISSRNTVLFPMIFGRWLSAKDRGVAIEDLEVIVKRVVTDNLFSCLKNILQTIGADIRQHTLDYAFCIALNVGNFRMALGLLEMDANPNAVLENDDAPLFKAVQAGHRKLVRALLIHPDVDIKKAFPKDDLVESATRGEHPHLVAMLLKEFPFLATSPHDTDSIFREIMESMPSIELLEACLGLGVTLEKRQGMTALVFALHHDVPLEFIRLLAQRSVGIDDHSVCIDEITYTLDESCQFHSQEKEVRAVLVGVGLIGALEREDRGDSSKLKKIEIARLLRRTNIPQKDQSELQIELMMSADQNLECLDKHPVFVSYQAQRSKVLAEIACTDIVLSASQQANIPLRGLQERLWRFYDRQTVENNVVTIVNPQRSSLAFFSQSNDSISYPCKMRFADITQHFLLVSIRKTNVNMCLIANNFNEVMSDYKSNALCLKPFQHIFEKPCLANQEGLKSIRQMQLSATFRINGIEKQLPIVYEMKTKSTADRILVAEMIPENGMGTVILLPVCLVKKGFHNNRHNAVSIYQGGEFNLLHADELNSTSESTGDLSIEGQGL